MDRFIVLIFTDVTATIVDCEPLLCDGCTSTDDAQQWAVEKHAEGRGLFNLVQLATAEACHAYIARFGYTSV